MNIKTLALLAASALLSSACTDTKKQEKDALNDVIKIHDEAMAKDEQAVKNKMLLDSLIKNKTITDTVQSGVAIKALTEADQGMEKWMHQFNADYTGKSHEEIIQYLHDQKKQVNQMNQRLTEAVNQSNQVITTTKNEIN
ncbi:hypothetical protein [Mucilaginibacter sp. CSA2-8R]|uniref:hypothetical protein n=1 Tax=Mucilaginibacter sp. CSA2-8R TaxID=3141542 RepID=UPI00315CF075